MKNKLLTLIFLFLTSVLYAQDYTFTLDSATYNDLDNPTSLNNGMTWEYPNYTIPIGFSFQFFDDTINTFYISEDNGPVIILGSENIDLGTSALVPFGATMVDRGMNYDTWEPSTGSLSPISYQVDGVEGNRIFKMEWKNTGFENDLWEFEDMATDFVNFQMWCYEATGVIEFRYGESHIEHFAISFYDETGPLVGIFPEINEDGPVINGLTLQGNAASPTMVETMNVSFLNGVPSNGTIYRFTPADTTGYLDAGFQYNIQLFPNPTHDNFYLKSEEEINEVFIYDNLGRMVKKFSGNKGKVSQLEAGVYFVKVMKENNYAIKKLIVD
jgi:hypothetical protein